MLENKKSTHVVEVVPVVLEKHPNADKLSIVKVYGYDCCVITEQWQGVNKAAFVPPDTLVDTSRSEFAFLTKEANADGKYRVKVKKLRGVVSYGMLIPVSPDISLGTDLSELFNTERYEPLEMGRSQKDKFIIGGEEEAAPDIYTGPEKYDIESFERYSKVILEDGEPITIQEKIDGQNCRFVYYNNRYYVKSRNRWIKREPDYSHVNMEFLTSQKVPEDKAKDIIERLNRKEGKVASLWRGLEAEEGVMKFLKDNPGVTVFGEFYGNVNRLKYFNSKDETDRFAAFDIVKDGTFVDINEYLDITTKYNIPIAPVLNVAVPYSFDYVKQQSTGKTNISRSNVIREGVVVKPVKERYQHRFGRVILKCVNPQFLELK